MSIPEKARPYPQEQNEPLRLSQGGSRRIYDDDLRGNGATYAKAGWEKNKKKKKEFETIVKLVLFIYIKTTASAIHHTHTYTNTELASYLQWAPPVHFDCARFFFL